MVRVKNKVHNLVRNQSLLIEDFLVTISSFIILFKRNQLGKSPSLVLRRSVSVPSITCDLAFVNRKL